MAMRRITLVQVMVLKVCESWVVKLLAQRARVSGTVSASAADMIALVVEWMGFGRFEGKGVWSQLAGRAVGV